MWHNFEEYKKWIYPTTMNNPVAAWRLMASRTALERSAIVMKKLHDLQVETQTLRDRWNKNSAPKCADDDDREIWHAAVGIAIATEELFLYCEPLAYSDAAADLRSHKDLYEHWDRYVKGRRLETEVPRLIEAAEAVAEEAHKHLEQAGRFIEEPVENLPPPLRRHFRMARDLFSVECPEMAAFAALRGLEATLREIARKQGLKIEQGKKNGPGKMVPLAEADLVEIIEEAKHLRWSTDGKPVMAQSSAAMLHLLRNYRNAVVHPRAAEQDVGDDPNCREVAVMAARFASSLWRDSKGGRRKIRMEKKD